MRTVLLMSSILLLGPVVAVQAQGWGRFGNPWGYGGIHRHSSTYEEGVQRGFADVVRSAGAKNLMDSEAAINWEEARRRYFDNRVYGTQKYFEMRAVNRQARAEERGPRPTMQDLIRYSSVRKPSRLDPNELDPLSGDITWPAALRGEQYLGDRAKVEELFAVRARNGFLDGEQLAEMKTRLQLLDAELKKGITRYPPETYTQAKNFIKSLYYESLSAPG